MLSFHMLLLFLDLMEDCPYSGGDRLCTVYPKLDVYLETKNSFKLKKKKK